MLEKILLGIGIVLLVVSLINIVRIGFRLSKDMFISTIVLITSLIIILFCLKVL